MKQREFAQTCLELSESDVRIAEARYDANSFGSWLVAVYASPPHRIVWDGKDGWLMIERKTDQTANGMPIWDTIWLVRERQEQTVENAVSRLRQLLTLPIETRT